MQALSFSMLLVVLGVIIVTSVTGQANILYNSTDCTGAARRVRYTPKVDCEEKGCASNEPFSTTSSLVTCTKTIEEAGNKTSPMHVYSTSVHYEEDYCEGAIIEAGWLVREAGSSCWKSDKVGVFYKQSCGGGNGNGIVYITPCNDINCSFCFNTQSFQTKSLCYNIRGSSGSMLLSCTTATEPVAASSSNVTPDNSDNTSAASHHIKYSYTTIVTTLVMCLLSLLQK